MRRRCQSQLETGSSPHHTNRRALSSGLRVGGWAVFAVLNPEPKQAYFDRIEKIAERTFPHLCTQGRKPWSGLPSTPDSVPVISRSRAKGIFYSAGHGHCGLSLAAPSAERTYCGILRAIFHENPSRWPAKDRVPLSIETV
ncbi:FAD-dependent oxidoreductase [Mesorhizobium sp. M0910]|uniref:FAD-dependent oxidoreductase n=1 Tax=Mesorhizobium sp. M0910 TaxID=2957025 RepID=UPI003334CC8A